MLTAFLQHLWAIKIFIQRRRDELLGTYFLLNWKAVDWDFCSWIKLVLLQENELEYRNMSKRLAIVLIFKLSRFQLSKANRLFVLSIGSPEVKRCRLRASRMVLSKIFCSEACITIKKFQRVSPVVVAWMPIDHHALNQPSQLL